MDDILSKLQANGSAYAKSRSMAIKVTDLLDFGKAYVDCHPPFSADILSDARKDQEEWFGDKLPVVESAMLELELIGIYYSDIRPGNIMFKD